VKNFAVSAAEAGGAPSFAPAWATTGFSRTKRWSTRVASADWQARVCVHKRHAALAHNRCDVLMGARGSAPARV